MAWQIISTDRSTALSLPSADSVTVLAGVSLFNTSAGAIVSLGSSQNVFAYGMIASSFTAIELGLPSSSRNFVYVGAEGIVSGGANGIVLRGSGHRIENRGDVTAGDDAIVFSGTANGNKVTNYGSVNGIDTAFTNLGTGTSSVLFTNFGTVTGERLAYDSTGSNNVDNLTNRGDIIGGISLGTGADRITNSGTITGEVSMGIGIDTIVNSGTVEGDILMGDGTDRITNTGTITGQVSMGIGADTVTNSGTIEGDILLGDGDDRLTNSGTITGEVSMGIDADTVTNSGTIATSILMGDGNDRIVNSGTIIGDVVLGGGRDTYIGNGTGTVTRVVSGGDGADNFILGAAAETIYGGEDLDFLDFTSQTGVRIALDDSFSNTGNATGDFIRGVEGVYGSHTGGDFIHGDVAANVFYAYGGADTLYGGANEDTLSGGMGNDILFGGAGNDVFLFFGVTEGADVINDFSNTATNNDRIQISAEELAFAGILGPRALLAAEFYVGTTNICTGVEDRIILRTTDNTVWFDSNGRSAGGLTMLADLQAGVTLTFADFVFV